MYSLFTKEEKFNFVTNFGSVDFIDKMNGLSSYAVQIYHILLKELKRLFFKKEIKEDFTGIYVELSREIIGDRVKGGLCAHTVAKYIKELQRYGLLIDRRMGLKLCNRIYLKYKTDAKRFDMNTNKSENTDNKNGQKNSGVATAINTPQTNPLINKANEIITQLTDECLAPRTINQMLILCKDNLDDLNSAVQYCFGKTPTKSYAAMLMHTLREQYHKKKQERKERREAAKSNKPKYPNKPSTKVEKFNAMESHGDWDFDKTEVAERLLLMLRTGDITQDEYQAKIVELGICNQ